MKWLESKYYDKIRMIEFGSKYFINKVESCMIEGNTLLITKIDDSWNRNLKLLIDFYNQKINGKISLWNDTLRCHPEFKLILQTKLANPHFKADFQYETTIINFTLNKDSFEEQILSSILIKERPDLEKSRFELIKQKNYFKIILKELESDILMRISNSKRNILDDINLIENFEKTKFNVKEIELKKQEADETTLKIDKAREFYRPVAKRGSTLFPKLCLLYY